MTRMEHRALRALADPRAIIARSRDGARFAVFADGDQRRRTCAELQREQVEHWLQQGLIVRTGRSLFRLSAHGKEVAAALAPSTVFKPALPQRLRECV